MHDLNGLVHDQIETYMAAPIDYDELNLNELISNINPSLWKAICSLTKSKSEIRGTSKVTDSNSAVYHVKRVRRYFLLCMIFFCTDD